MYCVTAVDLDLALDSNKVNGNVHNVHAKKSLLCGLSLFALFCFVVSCRVISSSPLFFPFFIFLFLFSQVFGRVERAHRIKSHLIGSDRIG